MIKKQKIKGLLRMFSVIAMIVGSYVVAVNISVAAETPSVSASAFPVTDTASDQNAVFLPTVSVENVKIDKGVTSTDQISGTFIMHNYSDLLIGDLGYTISLIDAAPVLKENTVVAESYQIYKEERILNAVSLLSKEKKEVSFKLQVPAIPKGQYRIRIHIFTSKNIGLGWDDADNITLGQDVGFLIVPMLWEAATNDIKNKSYALDGINVEPNSDVTLGFGYTNSGTKPLIVKPHIGIFEAKTAGPKVSEQTGDQLPIVKPVKKITDGSIQIKAPEKPGSYTIYLDFIDENGKTVSSVSEYRVVVKGGSGKVVNAWFKELTTNKAKIETSIVGPADDFTDLEVTAVVALLDGDNQIAEQTSKTLKLSGKEGSTVTMVFDFDFQAALRDPGLKVTLKDAQGNVLDSYSYKVPATKTTIVPSTAQPNPVKSQKQSVGALVLGIIIALLGVIGAIWSLVRGHRGGKDNIATTIMMLMIVVGAGLTVVNLPIARAYTFATLKTPAAGAGNSYYYYAAEILAYINKPIIDPSATVGRIVPVSFRLEWTKCSNRDAKGGFAIDYQKGADGRGGKITPTVYNWAPIHDIKGAKIGYHGNVADKSNWSVAINPTQFNSNNINWNDCGRPYGYGGNDTFCVAYANYSGSFTVPEEIVNTTFRLTGYRKGADGTTAGWFGIFGWMNFPPLLPVGSNGGVDCNTGLANGWACQRLDYNQPLGIHFYVDGAAVPPYSYFRGATTADQPGEPAIGALCGGYPNHRYVWAIPNNLKDGLTHSLYAYAIGLNNSGNPLLNSAPVTFNCPAPVLAPTVSLTASPNPVDSGSASTLSWSTTNSPTSCTASGDWSGSKNTSGGTESTGNLSVSKTYSLTCSNTGGSAQSSVTVNVNAPTPILSCSASPTSIYTGSEVTFTVNGASAGSTYTWDPLTSGATLVSGYSFNSNPLKVKFSTSGSKTITASSSGTVSCSMSVNISNRQTPGSIKEI